MAAPPHAVNLVNGTPTLMVDGHPLPAPVFCLYYDQALNGDVVRQLSENGLGAFACRSRVAVGAGDRQNASIEQTVHRLASAARHAPDAVLMADCVFYPSAEWMLINPGGGYITADNQVLVMGPEANVEGEGKRRDYVKVPGPSIEDARGQMIQDEEPAVLYGQRRVSPFSTAFGREAALAAERLLRAIEAEGITERLWAFFIGCYNCGEWNTGMYWPDWSAAGVKGFRDFLRREYGDDDALRRAWGDRAVTLDDAMPPREHTRLNFNTVQLWNRPGRDYRRAEAEALSEQFLTIARAVKGALPRANVGGFFPGISAYQSDCLRLYRDDAVSFVATPLSYENCGAGGGVSSQSPFCDALSKFGKVWFDELDTRTHLSDPEVCFPWGRAVNADQSVGMLWREAGQMLIRGHHGWWLDFGCAANHKNSSRDFQPPFSWHVDPDILRFHRQFADLWAQLPELNRRPVGDIKLFTPSNGALSAQLCGEATWQRHTEWTLLGAPVECDILENLLEGLSEPGKLNIMCCMDVLDDETLDRLRERCVASDAWFVWMGPAGALTPGGMFDLDRCERLTGIALRMPPMGDAVAPTGKPTAEAQARFSLPPDSLLGQCDRPMKTGFTMNEQKDGVAIPKEMPPVETPLRWAIVDKGATPLVRDHETGAVLAAMKKTANATHVLYMPPTLNNRLLRPLARAAGAHIYIEGDDVVYASRGLLLVHASEAGRKEIHLPQRMNVFDVREDREAASSANRFDAQMEFGESRMYILNPC